MAINTPALFALWIIIIVGLGICAGESFKIHVMDTVEVTP